MTGSFCEDRLLEVLHAIPLEATADIFLSRSMRRLSPTNGLPDDGHVLHTAVQGKASFLFFGQDRNIQVEAVEGTESKWELPGHRASVFVTGESAAGKDTVIKIIDAIDASIKSLLGVLPCFNTLRVGHPTYAGMLTALKKGRTEGGTSMLVWYNSEIKACLTTKEGGVKEEHLCQLAEGTQVGKTLKDKEVCVTPNCWFVIGAQPEAMQERFGGTDNGRVRAFSAFLDRRKCTEIPLAKKFAKRTASFTYTTSVLAVLARCQQRSSNPDVMKVVYDTGAYTVFAAMHDALSEVLSCHEAASPVVATLIKLVGKGHGTLAVANCGLRNTAWVGALSSTGRPGRFMDGRIRFEDALAAAMKVELHIVSQLYTEHLIARASAKQTFANVEATIFDEVANASRRILDYSARTPKSCHP